MNPLQIKLHNDSHLKIKWADGSETLVSLKYLRDQCPCAHCKGENIMLRNISPVKKSQDNADKYSIASVKITGGYAVQISWKDGHEKGIYTWDYLKTLSETEPENINHEYKPLI